MKKLSEKMKIGILLGTPYPTGKNIGRGLYNSALLIHKGKEVFVQHKSLLPTYDVFDEARYFDSAPQIEIFKFKNINLGLTICEDAWNDDKLWTKRLYEFDPVENLAKQGADIIINISASPFFSGKEKIRFKIIKNHVKKHHVSFLFLNQVGGNDELIFDGRSMFINENGKTVSGSSIQAKINDVFKTIASFEKDSNDADPIFESKGNYLSSRANLSNPTPSLPNTVIITFNQLECEDEREYKCTVTVRVSGDYIKTTSNVTSIVVKGKYT